MLRIHNRQVTIELDWWEKLAAHRSHLTVPLRAITEVQAVPDVFALPDIASGDRDQATRIRGITATGTLEREEPAPGAGSVGSVTFAVCHGSTPRPGLIIDLQGCTVDRIVMSTWLAESEAEKLRTHVAAAQRRHPPASEDSAEG